MYSEETLIDSKIYGFCIMSTWAVMVEGDEYKKSTSCVTLRQLVDNYELFL